MVHHRVCRGISCVEHQLFVTTPQGSPCAKKRPGRSRQAKGGVDRSEPKHRGGEGRRTAGRQKVQTGIERPEVSAVQDSGEDGKQNLAAGSDRISSSTDGVF